MSLFARWADDLRRLRDEGRYRSLRPPAGHDFTSNDYLGYASRGQVVSHCMLPASGAASRLLRGDHPVWHEVEAALAAWHGAEATLMMTSGYVTNEGLLSTVIEPGDWVATDALNHASIGDGLRLIRPRKFVFRHNDLNHLEDGLRSQAAEARPGRERFVVTESLFSMDGDRSPLREMAELAERYGAHLIVDEAHATGCFGPAGSGCVDEAGLRDRVLATVHTGGKALGVCGAYVCGSAQLKELLVNRCRHLIFTTALPPAAGEWWLAALTRVRTDDAGRRALHANARRFRELLAQHHITASGTGYVVPIIIGDDARAVEAAGRLQERGFDVRAIRPPSVPQDTARLRISIHADHEPNTLAALATALREALHA
jgi:8-amino-7-oxononanoate synthase